jgi:hypothetical protein
MSVAFTREESAETAAEVGLPDRPISPYPNLVTNSGLEALSRLRSRPTAGRRRPYPNEREFALATRT